jgi:hypothetical protein
MKKLYSFEWDAKIILNVEIEGIWKEAIVAYFNLLYRNSPGFINPKVI